MLLDAVRAYCLKHNLLTPGPVVVAVSGGADSLTLLHIMLKLQENFDITPHVATFDHGIRAVAGTQDVEFVRALAERWGVPITTGSADVPALARGWHMGLEEAARKERYRFLTDTATLLNATTIATGHNQDDQAETVLLHIIRGTGLTGLRGMLPKSQLSETISLIRPLLDTPRTDIEAYLHDIGLEPRADATNADTHYTRNRLRHEIMPFLAEINPQVRSALARTADTIRDDYEALVSALPPLNGSSSDFVIDRDVFRGLSVSLQRLWIREAAQRLSPNTMLTLERSEAALDLAKSPSKKSVKIPLGGNLWLKIAAQTITVTASPNAQHPYPDNCPSLEANSVIPINGPGQYSLPRSQWQLSVERLQTVPETLSEPLSAILAIEDGAKLELRTRRRGDHFKPLGLDGHSQKLKETLINLKVPQEWRDHVPLLMVNNEIAWLVAPTLHGPISRISQPFATTPTELRPLLRLTFTQTSTDVTL